VSDPSATPDPAQDAPHCYRHPDRETYIRCQRCERPICPECMAPASVGFHCPECVAEGNRSVRQPRTAAGGLVPERPGAVTIGLMAANVLAFLACVATGYPLLGGGVGTSPVTEWGVQIGQASFGMFQPLEGVAEGQPWRLVTSGFLHGGVIHLLVNMYALYVFGPLLEQLLGRARFVAVYALSLLGGSAAVYALEAPNVPTLGASGAIAGLFGCALVLLVQRGQNVAFLFVILAINVVLSLQSGISWQAHLGGFVVGLVLGLAFAFAPRAQRALVQYAAMGAVAAVIVATIVLRTSELGGSLIP